MKQMSFFSINTLEESFSLDEGIAYLKTREWKQGAYEKQSWGHSLHRIGPYVGRIKPSFAHFLIKYLSLPGDTILDPFCGIGTISLEGALMERKTIGFDINPYALAIAKSKTQVNLSEEKLLKIVKKINIDTNSINIDQIPEWVKDYYNLETLKEITFLLNYFKRNRHHYLYGCLLAISQGHRIGHLSKPSAWTLPFKPKPDDPGEYREVKPRLIAKIKRNLKDGSLSKNLMTIDKCDARRIKLKKNSIDMIISSPPYFNTLDYINSHRLRLAVMGFYDEEKKTKLKKQTIQHFKSYLDEMEKVILQLKHVLKNGSKCCFVVGDHFTSNKVINTSEKLLEIFERNGFQLIDNIEDPIPVNKSVQKRTSKIKYERVLVVEKE